MGKSVVWIDDNVNVMKEVVSYVFPSLWDKEITSYIAFTSKPGEALKDLNRIIFDQFVSYLISKDIINDDEKVISKVQLVKSSKDKTASDVSDKNIPTADVAMDISSLFEKYQDNICAFYEKSEAADKDMNTCDVMENENENAREISKKEKINHCSFADNFTKEIIDKFPNGSWFGIDLCLTDDDVEILGKRRDSPILSMALYYSLKNKNQKVFLYSTYIVPTDIIDGWKSLYSKYFNVNINGIDVYNRRGKNVSHSGNARELIQLLEET